MFAGFGAGYERYTQTQRLEQCMYPGSPCSYLDPHYPSSCLQKHNFVRLLAYTYTVHTRKRRRVFTGRQRPKTLTMLFCFIAQTRRLRQPRPASAAAADQNIQFSSKSNWWGR